jgi:4-amino-4-deoxy-L-arabinose transferase-like glycosyltransferase
LEKHFENERLLVSLLVIISALLYLPGIGSLPLTDPDESRCCMIVQNMINTGNWLIPFNEGEIYFDKPAPFFWLAAAGQFLTGSIEMGGRLVAALSSVFLVLVTYFFTKQYSSKLAGFAAGVILATSPEVFYIGRWYRMDMIFTAFMWAAMWWFWRYEQA